MPSDELWKRWQKKFDWLRGIPERSKCALCPDFQTKIWKKSQLIQHEQGKKHSLAAGRSCCPDEGSFGKVLSERINGISLRKSSAGRYKTIKMMWCMNEAVKNIVKKRALHNCIHQSRWSGRHSGSQNVNHQLWKTNLRLNSYYNSSLCP